MDAQFVKFSDSDFGADEKLIIIWQNWIDRRERKFVGTLTDFQYFRGGNNAMFITKVAKYTEDENQPV